MKVFRTSLGSGGQLVKVNKCGLNFVFMKVVRYILQFKTDKTIGTKKKPIVQFE